MGTHHVFPQVLLEVKIHTLLQGKSPSADQTFWDPDKATGPLSTPYIRPHNLRVQTVDDDRLLHPGRNDH